MTRIIYGSDTQKLNNVLFFEIKKDLDAVRSGENDAKQVLLIVPAQFTLEAERLAFELLGGPGFFDFHIMSGNKLRAEIVKQTGGPGCTAVNGIGRSMLLRRIAAEKASELTAFGGVCTKPGFDRLAGDFIVQLRQNRFCASDIDRIIEDAKPGNLLAGKLKDMQLICSEYDKAMAGRFTDSESMLQFTASKVPESDLVKDSIIWFYDFYSFTPNELSFIAQLIGNSRGFGLALLHEEDTENEAFAVTARTIAKIKAEAASSGEETVMLFAGNREENSVASTRLVRCSTPHTQALTIGLEILEFLREGRASCDEIAVLTGDMEGCGSEIKRVFADLGIPLFADEKRSVQHNPAVRLISSLLDMSASGMKSEYVLNFLHSGLADCALAAEPPVTAEDIDIFENYIKQYHIDGKRFETPFRYGAAKLGEDVFCRLEAFRAALCALICPFLKELKQAGTVREKTQTLCSFLAVKLGLPQALDACALKLSDEGCADASGECSQIWGILTGLMDQAVELIGDAALSADDFCSLYEDAFRDIKVGLLPQQSGRVTLGTVKRSKLNNIKALFIAGCNEGQIPAEQGGEALLTEDELAELSEKGYTLGKSSSILAQEDKLNVFRALLAPSDYLWIGYCLEDAASASLRPSGIVLDMIADGAVIHSDAENGERDEVFFCGRRAVLPQLSRRLSTVFAGEAAELSPLWQQAYNVLHSEKDPALDILVSGLLFTNGRKPLDTDAVRSVFSEGTKGADRAKLESFRFSASQLENYASCAFRHFVAYGLSPDEPRDFSIAGAEIGEIYHSCLMKLCSRLSEPAISAGISVTDPSSLWMTVTREETERLVNGIMDEISGNTLEGIMNSSPEEQYRSKRLREVAVRFAWQMIQQLRRGSVDRMSVELPFGFAGGSPFEFETSAGNVRIAGRIDRLDVSGKYVKVIDYKSGKKKFDRKEVEEGYALQLMVYLEGALAREKNSEPAGMFYYLIGDDPAECTLEDIAADRISDDVMQKIEQSYMLSGLYAADDSAVSTIDASAISTGTSEVIDFKRKDGVITAKSAIDPSEFVKLRAAFREKLEACVNELNSGNISPVPHRRSQTSACTYCPYHSICLFDTQFGDNFYK